MSLKAKLEAVIYAAEEPVTLAQLTALFAADAREWKAAHEAASANEASAKAEPDTAPLLNAEFDYAQTEQPGPAETVEVIKAREIDGFSANRAPETEPELVAEAEPDSVTEATPIIDPEAEARRQARAEEREVRAVLRKLLDGLIGDYASDDRGIEIKEIAGGFRMATKPECHDAARMFVKSLKPALKLSLAALETLAVVAYKQPITAPEVNEIRGVESSGVFGSLLSRKLIATAGRKQVIGRPILYKTTKEFLLKFGMNEVSELPSMEEFEKMAQLEFEGMEPAEGSEVGEPQILEVDEDPDLMDAEEVEPGLNEPGLNEPGLIEPGLIEPGSPETAVTGTVQSQAPQSGPEDPEPGQPEPMPVEDPAGQPAQVPIDEPPVPAEPPAGDPPADPDSTELSLDEPERIELDRLEPEQAETETVPHE